jgi:hypothetical protein
MYLRNKFLCPNINARYRLDRKKCRNELRANWVRTEFGNLGALLISCAPIIAQSSVHQDKINLATPFTVQGVCSGNL